MDRRLLLGDQVVALDQSGLGLAALVRVTTQITGIR
jgi:hypothetical protein